jgi:hypothetical protein
MSGDPFASLLPRLQAALLGESARLFDTPVIVAVRDLGTLTGYWATRRATDVRFTRLAGRADAVVQIGPCGASLWMDPAATGYRDAYARFLRDHWGAKEGLGGSGYDVDHVYNRARALHYGYRFVRMFLVRAEANRAHGRSYEKQIGAVEAKRKAKIMKLLDGMSELKVLGLPPVHGGVLLREHHEAAMLAARTYRIPHEAALATLRALYARAHPGG